MYRAAIILLFCSALFSWAQETATVDDMQFTKIEDVWVHDALPDEYDVEERFSAVTGDEKWKAWYESGNDKLRAVLDLGPNVAFIMTSAEDGELHIFSAWENEKRLDCAVDHDKAYVMGNVNCPKVGWWVKAGIPIGAIITGAIIVNDEGGGTTTAGDEASPIRPKI